MSEANIAGLLKNVKVETYIQGEVIFKEKDSSNGCLYLILEGSIIIQKMRKGVEEFIDIINKGSFFGEIAIFTHLPRQTTMITYSTFVRLLVIRGDEFIPIIKSNPNLMRQFIQTTISRLDSVADYYVRSGFMMEDWRAASPELNQCRQKNLELIQQIRAPVSSTFDKGKIIFKEGDECRDFFYLIERGSVAVQRPTNTKFTTFLTILILESGDFVGERILIGSAKRVDRIIALSDKTVLKIIHKSIFEQVVKSMPEFYFNYLKSIIWKLNMLDLKINSDASVAMKPSGMVPGTPPKNAIY